MRQVFGLALVIGVFLVPGEVFADPASVVGTWSMSTDWGCTGGTPGTFTQTFRADGTWTSTPFVHSGRWYQVECLVVWTFTDTPNLVYAANLSGSWMAGVQGYETAGGTKGCFGARRAGFPATEAHEEAPAANAHEGANEGIDPALGRSPAKAEAKRTDPVLGR